MPKIIIKTPEEIEIMREGGKILANCLQETALRAKPGISTLELDQFAEKFLRDHNTIPSFKGYAGFPATLCTNIDNVVVHGIPKKDEILKEGQFIAIDCGTIYKGFHTDSTVFIGIGKISTEKKKMISVAEEALGQAIMMLKDGVYLGELSGVIEDTITKNGYSVVEELTGHGVGRKLHEYPYITNYRDQKLPIFKAGMTIAVEPIFTNGNGDIRTLADNWTIVTADNSLAAQIEHTLLVTENGCEVLTQA